MKAAIFIGGYFEYACKINSILEGRAFCSGINTITKLLNGEDVNVYILPNDDKLMRDNESEPEVVAAGAFKL